MSVMIHPAEETYVVAGTREEWSKRCEQTLREHAYFRFVERMEAPCRITAQYRRPPVWGEIIVTLAPEGPEATRITARAITRPNLFTLVFEPEQRILDDFACAIGQRVDTSPEDAD